MSSKFQNGELSSFRDMTDYVESRQLGAQHHAPSHALVTLITFTKPTLFPFFFGYILSS